MPGGKDLGNQIKRTKTVNIQKTGPSEDVTIKKAPTMTDIGMTDFSLDISKKETRLEKENDRTKLKALKEKTEQIPVLVPSFKIVGKEDEEGVPDASAVKEARESRAEQKSEVKAGQKNEEKKAQKQTVQKNELENAKDMIRDLHQTLEAQEKGAFSEKARKNIRRSRYKDLSASDIKKRAKEAVKRKKNAQKVMEYDLAHPDSERQYAKIDLETLKKNIASFKKLPSKPYDLDTDEKFAANMEKNYQLCEAADRMKHWLRDASDAGYMPKGEDMASLQEKIAAFEEVKRYMDIQKDLMKNPYYQYFAKKDITYTNIEMKHFADKAKDPALKSYLVNMQSLRSLEFSRSKGMKSVKTFAKEQGKKQAEILTTKQEKRSLVDALEDKFLHTSENPLYLDKDYDSRFSKELFQQYLRSLKNLDFKTLHFAGIKDIVEHYDENRMIFDQVHNLEHLLMVAVNRGLAPPDQEMITIRTKMETLIMAERMVAEAHQMILKNPDAFLNERTYGDIADRCFTGIKSFTDKEMRQEPPRFGQDLSKYFRSLQASYKQGHRDREKSISLFYGMAHPEQAAEGENAGELIPGTIPEKELKRRSEGFQANAFRTDCLRNMEVYIEHINGSRLSCIASAHARRTGRKVMDSFGRTLTPFLTGKSSDEIIRVINIVQAGTEAEKEKLYRNIAEEAFSVNFSDFDNPDPSVFYGNAAARMRIAKILGNLGGSNSDTKSHVKDPELIAKIDGYYNAGCGQDFSSKIAQCVKTYGCSAIFYEDFFVKDTADINLLINNISDQIEEQIDGQKKEKGPGEYKGSFRVGDDTFAVTLQELQAVDNAMRGITFMKDSAVSRYHQDRAGKGIRDSAYVALYDELKNAGYHKSVTKEQVEELRNYYRNYEKGYKENGDKLVAELKNRLRPFYPKIDKANSKRTWILSNMLTLSRSTYGRKNQEEQKEQFSAQEIEKSAKLYERLLITDQAKAKPEERQERALAIEEMFRYVMDFDLSRMNFRSYSDLIKEGREDPGRFKECHAVTRLSMEVVNFIDDYKKLRMDEEVSCRLNEVDVEEVSARCDLLMSIESLFDVQFMTIIESPELEKTGMPLDDLLHLTQEEIEQKLADSQKTGDFDIINFWTGVKIVTSQLEGFDIGIPATVVEEHFRKKRGLFEKSRAMEIRNMLNGAKRVLNDDKPGEVKLICENDAMFEGRFSTADKVKDRKHTVSERETKLFNKNSRLYKKRIYSEALKKGSREVVNNDIRLRTGIALKNRIAVGEETLADLSAFMKGNTEENNALAEAYADDEKRFELIDTFTREIMEMNLDLTVTTDQQFANFSGYLEEISHKAMAYDRILKANPKYLDRLRNRRVGRGQSDLEKVEVKRNYLLAVSDYYRARKLLMTDNYYILHYDDELTGGYADRQTQEQKRVSELIILVATCTRRLEGKDFRTREGANLDTVLSRAEEEGLRQAYLTGRVDLAKAGPASVHKANKEIERYMEAAGIDNLENVTIEEIAGTDDNVPYPEAEGYKTEAAKNYFEAVRTYARMAKNQEKILSPKEKAFISKLTSRFKDRKGSRISIPTFIDPKTKEVWMLNDDINRFPIEIVKDYGVEMPEEEILDIFDGLLLTQREELDLNDEAARQYARDRWLSSMQKLFYLEYNSLKRYESTYGTLVDEMPHGSFMMSLGGSLKDFVTRNRFGQNVAILCDRNSNSTLSCKADGKNLTVVDLLVKYGMIPKEVAEDAISLNNNYYQVHQMAMNGALQSVSSFGNKENRQDFQYLEVNLRAQQYTKDHKQIRGPKLTTAESRKLWKEALDYRDDINVVGNNACVEFQRVKLDLFTPAQKKELKAGRAGDKQLVDFYGFYLDELKEDLLKQAKSTLGAGISDELLSKLIVFHPSMYKKKQTKGDDPKQLEEFYDMAKKFLGIGIPEDQQEDAKRDAASKLLSIWDGLFTGGVLAGNIDDLMGSRDLPKGKKATQARQKTDEIVLGSRLLIGEVRHRMTDSIRELLYSDPDVIKLLPEKEQQKMLDARMRKQMDQEILRAIITNKDYLELKDVGSRRKSYPERMYEELIEIKRLLDQSHMTLDQILDGGGREVFKYYGIICPEKAEPVQKAAEQVKEESKEEKAEVKKGEKAEEKKGEKAEEKKGEEAEEKKEEEAEVKKEEKAEIKAEEKKEEKIGDNLDAELAQQAELHYEMPPIEYQQVIMALEKGKHVPYENQGDSTYCWACVMSGLMNAYAGKKVSDLNAIRKKPLAIPEFEESGITNKNAYDKGVDLVNRMYDGTAYGNPAIFGDYIFDKLGDVAVRSVIISREEGRLDYCRRRFLETVSTSLKKGPVGFLKDGHFVLIRGLEGDKLKVNDSMSAAPDQVADFDSTVSQIFASAGQQLELVWLEDLKGQEDQIAEQFNLDYSAEKKEFSLKHDGVRQAQGQGQVSYDQPKNEQTLLHRKGVEATAQYYDDVVFSSIYVPKQMKRDPEGRPGGQPENELIQQTEKDDGKQVNIN